MALSMRFEFEMGTSIPIEDLLEYFSLADTIASKMTLIQHLLHHHAELGDIHTKSTWHIDFLLKQPFPHRLIISSRGYTHPESLLEIVDMVSGTVWEGRCIRLLCDSEIFRSEYGYWVWKSQQKELYQELLLELK